MEVVAIGEVGVVVEVGVIRDLEAGVAIGDVEDVLGDILDVVSEEETTLPIELAEEK